MIDIIIAVLLTSLNYMVPILLASIGEILTERSGVVNIGLEGIMNIAAFTSAVISFFYGDPLMAVASGIVIGASIGLLHGIISTYLKGDQIVAGIGVNSLSYGLSVMGLVVIWKHHGASPSVPTLTSFSVGGKFGLSPVVPIAIALAIAFWFLLRSRVGLRIRACGEEPRAAEAMGVNVIRVRICATVLGSSLAGFAGSYISVGMTGQFIRGIAAGRGFIALANVAFSGWDPLRAIFGAYVFGMLEILSITIPVVVGGTAAISIAYPVKTLPYLGTLLIVMAYGLKAVMPRALGKPYIKE